MMNHRLMTGLLALFILALVGLPVQAHSELLSSRPAPGEVLPISPPIVTLTFNEPVGSGTIDIFGADFNRIHGVELAEPDMPEELTADLPELPVGIYTVQWSVVSEDGHEISGSYEFEVTEIAEGGWATWLFMGFILLGFGALWLQRRRILQREDRAYGL